MKTTAFFPLNRRAVLAGTSALMLGGCSDLLGPSEAPRLYVLKPTMAPMTPGTKVSWALSIPIPNASAGLDTQRIAIMHPPANLDYYANAAWSDGLPALVQTALLEAFENSGRIDAVSRDSDAARMDYILAADIRDFEARYDTQDGAPTAVVHIDVQLIDAVKRNIVAHFAAAEELTAAANSVDAAVAAFDEALSQARTKIVEWALNAPPSA